MANKVMISTLAAVVAAGISLSSQVMAAGDGDQDMEKCYGVVKASKNDCGSANHACAGQAKTDGHSHEWLYLPKGTCEKLHGGSTTKGEGGKNES